MCSCRLPGLVVQVVPCLALFDTMKYIGSDVGTVGFGACMGMSGFMLAMGKKVPFHLLPCRLCLESVTHCHVSVTDIIGREFIWDCLLPSQLTSLYLCKGEWVIFAV